MKPNTDLTGLSLFANIGVAEAYLDSIGCRIALANEIEASRATLYSQIYPDVEMLIGDICDEEVRNLLVEKSIAYGVDFDGDTTLSGYVSRWKIDPDDPRNTLVYYAIDVIKRVQPKFVPLKMSPTTQTFVVIDGKKQRIPQYIYDDLCEMYHFNCDATGQDSLVKASHYGVPQMRTRSILLVRKDLICVGFS